MSFRNAVEAYKGISIDEINEIRRSYVGGALLPTVFLNFQTNFSF